MLLVMALFTRLQAKIINFKRVPNSSNSILKKELSQGIVALSAILTATICGFSNRHI